MKKLFLVFLGLVPLVGLGQSFSPMDLPWYSGQSSVARFYPTNAAAVSNVWWGETIPIAFEGTFGEVAEGSPHPVPDGHRILVWTNWSIAGNKWTSDQSIHATNFTSGGGASGLTSRLLYKAASSTRMVGGSIGVTTNIFEITFVCEFDDFSNGSVLINGSGTVTTLQTTTGGALKVINNSTTITGPTTIQANQWYVISLVQNGTTATVYTNGVQYLTGTVGNVGMGSINIFDGFAGSFRGNVTRLWGWFGNLTSGDRASVVTQCKTDFGIP